MQELRGGRGAARPVWAQGGLAFQIADDVLDMTQDSAALGKTAGKDWRRKGYVAGGFRD